MSESFRLLTDPALLAQCRIDHYRGSGPGGQKRNKTSNAIRLLHTPTGLIVTATESRSLAENQLNAARRLRVKLAADVREPIDLARFEPPDWFQTVRHQRRIDCSHRHLLYGAVGGLILDLMNSLASNPAAVAANLGVNTSAVVKFMHGEPAWWAATSTMRKAAGEKPLVARS